MTEPMSAETFRWALTIVTAALAGPWLLYDTYNLIRTRKLDRKDPVVRDRHFGYAIGILVGIVGVLGCLLFQGVI
jgi:hypothetical protein